MKIFVVILMLGLSSLAYAGDRVKRNFTVPLLPGDELLVDQVPFVVDKDTKKKLAPQEMTTNELNHHLNLMQVKRHRRDRGLLNKNLVDPKANPYQGK